MNSDLRLSRKDFRTLQRHMAQPRPCWLCATFPAPYNVIFRPDFPARWGGKPGKVRLIGYALCHACSTKPDVTLRAEAKLMADLIGRKN